MHQFNISIQSFRGVKDFVELAMTQPFEVLVGNEKQQINAKSFIGMFSLDYKKPLHVRVNCTKEEFLRFQQAAAQFLV